MTFGEVLDQALAMLQRRGRVTYRALQLHFELDECRLTVLKDDLLFTHPEISDEEGQGLVWSGEAATPNQIQKPETDGEIISHIASCPIRYRHPKSGDRREPTGTVAS